MKNFTSSKQKNIFLILFAAFCFLCSDNLVAQKTFRWNGSVSNAWTNPSNWTVTGTGSTSTFPGEDAVTLTDRVVINSGSVPNLPTIATTIPNSIEDLLISNATTPAPTLTINVGATLNVLSAANNPVRINGANIVNNGVLDIKTIFAGAVVTAGILCNNPAVGPGAATTYGYSGSGELKIDISAATNANSSAILVTGLNTNTTYRFLFNGPIDFKLAAGAAVTTYILRAASVFAGTQQPVKVLVGGIGFTAGTTATPFVGGLFSLLSGNTITVNTGTVLTVNSSPANITDVINATNIATSNILPTNFINRGTINILGFSTRAGINLSTSSAETTTQVNFENQNVINVDMAIAANTFAPLNVTNNGSNTTPGTVTITNTVGAVLTLKNNQPRNGTANIANAMRVFMNVSTPNVNFTNDGTVTFMGNNEVFGGQARTFITNNSIINSNASFVSATITNNATGVFNFLNPTATFTVDASVAATEGAVYTDTAGSSYIVVTTKVSGTGTLLVLRRETSVATVTPPIAVLTKVSGTGDASISYTVVSSSISALAAETTNAGTINTGSGVESNGRLFGVTTTAASSVLSPGGLLNKGVASLPNTTLYTIRGRIVMQVSGNSAAGIDYDQITKTTAGNLDIDGCVLDVSGIYTPTTTTFVDIITVGPALSLVITSFSNVIGLGTGWSVSIVPGIAGRVRLNYNPLTPTTNTTWTGGANTTQWANAANWSNGVPGPNSVVTIAPAAFQPSTFLNVIIKSLTVDLGATLTINPTYNFTVTDDIANNGTITVLNNANLLQNGVTNSNTGSGSYNIRRNSNPLMRLDYTLWSSPVQNQNLLTFSPETVTNRFYNYSSLTNLYTEVDPTTTSFDVGKGYLIRMPDNHPTTPTTWAGNFVGTVNNGPLSVALNTNANANLRYNLVGNPYPSPINISSFVSANSANITGTLWFWRKTNSTVTATVYPTWNGGTLVGNSEPFGNPLSPSVIRNAQGFFVQALETPAGPLVFNNLMRQPENSNQFFKSATNNVVDTNNYVEKHRIWLQLADNAGYAYEQAISYIAGGTIALDAFDAQSINGGNMLFNSLIPNTSNEYVIQSRPLPFDLNDVVPLSIKITNPGSYTISINEKDGLFADDSQPIYLKDNYSNTTVDLNLGAYTFTATNGVFNDRFELRFINNALSTPQELLTNKDVVVYQNDGELVVETLKSALSRVTIYDMGGRVLVSKTHIDGSLFKTNISSYANQVLLVQIEDINGVVLTKKIIR